MRIGFEVKRRREHPRIAVLVQEPVVAGSSLAINLSEKQRRSAAIRYSWMSMRTEPAARIRAAVSGSCRPPDTGA